jgi:DnaK suppressor protein
MKAETVSRIDAALRRLEAGVYGDCSQCGSPIAAERLRALPFAVRCRKCESSREQDSAAGRQHVHAAYRDPSRDLVE